MTYFTKHLLCTWRKNNYQKKINGLIEYTDYIDYTRFIKNAALLYRILSFSLYCNCNLFSSIYNKNYFFSVFTKLLVMAVITFTLNLNCQFEAGVLKSNFTIEEASFIRVQDDLIPELLFHFDVFCMRIILLCIDVYRKNVQ